MYKKELKLKHNELPAIVDAETGEVTIVKERKNNIPDGKEVFQPDGFFKKDYSNSWKFLNNNLSPLEYKCAHTLALMAKANTNSLEPLNDDTTLLELMEVLGVSINKVKPILKKLWELGVYGKFEVKDADKPYTKYWIFNPYLSCSEEFVFTKEIDDLFKKTLFFNKDLDYDLSNVSPSDNLYIVAQETKIGVVYKLGYSKNIINRLKQYFYHNPSIQVIKTFYREDGELFEKEFHLKNKSIYLNEWYDLNTMKKWNL